MKLFVFGSTGDLVKRKVLIALEKVKEKNLEIICLGRKEMTTQEYLQDHCKECKRDIKYKFINFEDKKLIKNLIKELNEKEINYFYLSLPPKINLLILEKLIQLKKKGFRIKVLIEKPFGENLKQGLKFAKIISRNNLEKDFFISDHYLFKKEILDLEKKDFKKLEIYSFEEVGLENRIGYYDDIGALKDMIQSHFFNILFKLSKDKIDFKDFKLIEAKKSQYKEYEKELGKKSKTETYVKLIFKFREKEIIFETGKKFKEKVTKIILDNQEINVFDLNPYTRLFEEFFENKRKNFPTIANQILSWKIIKKIEKNKIHLEKY